MAALARQPMLRVACVGKLFPAEVLQGFGFPMLEDLVLTSCLTARSTGPLVPQLLW